MTRQYQQTHLMSVPTTFGEVAQWCRRAAITINGLLNGQDARPAVWTDYAVSMGSAQVSGANAPTWSALKNGVYAYLFSASATNEVWVSFHINHDIALTATSKIFPAVYWCSSGANTGVARWGIEYTYAKSHNQDAFGASTTVYVEQAGPGTAFQVMTAEASDGDAISVQTAGVEPDGILMCRVFRDGAHASDTLTDTAYGLSVSLHVQIERVGTINRAPNFYEAS